jgi:hypothetical protein
MRYCAKKESDFVPGRPRKSRELKTLKVLGPKKSQDLSSSKVPGLENWKSPGTIETLVHTKYVFDVIHSNFKDTFSKQVSKFLINVHIQRLFGN